MSWIAFWVAVSSAVFAVLLLAAVAFLLLRTPRPPAAQVGEIVREATAYLSDALTRAQEDRDRLARTLEREREETLRARQLAALGATLELDELLRRVLEAATAVPGVDAAMISLAQGEGAPVVAAVGLTEDEVARQPFAGLPGGGVASGLTVSYRYSAADARALGELVRAAAAVPLPGEGDEPIGTLAAFGRGEPRDFSDEQLSALEELAARAGPATANAQRFRAARELADLDALTKLHNRRYFYEKLDQEVKRAQRYSRELSLLVFDLDDFKAINDRVGHLSGDAVLAEVGERIRSVVRSADIPARVGGDEFAVVLPESSREDAEQLYRRLRRAVSEKPLGPIEHLHLSAGVADVRPEDDGKSLFERADEALYRAKQSGKGQLSPPDESG